MKTLIYVICGVIFGMGLSISQMVDPSKVLGFLDVFGQWDPSLAFVMTGGLLVFGLGYWFIVKPRRFSLTGATISPVPASPIDKKLLVGSSLFGIGWGLVGICPGPALANLSNASLPLLLFTLAMVTSLVVTTKLTLLK